MDSEPERSIWSRLFRHFSNKGTDVEHAIIQAQEDGELEADEGSMLLGILELDSRQAQDIMVPRTDMICVDVKLTIHELATVISESGHSRIPIYQDTKDNIVGVAFAKDLLQVLVNPEKITISIPKIMRKPFFVPETKNVHDILSEFKTRKNHLAIVIDEYGGTSGIVTIEDVLEVIVGEIEDEHDAPREEDILVISPNTYSLSGRVWLEDLAPIGISLDSEEVDTLGGYISLTLGRVPKEGESIEYGNWKFTITEAAIKQILRIQAEPISAQKEAIAQ